MRRLTAQGACASRLEFLPCLANSLIAYFLASPHVRSAGMHRLVRPWIGTSGKHSIHRWELARETVRGDASIAETFATMAMAAIHGLSGGPDIPIVAVTVEPASTAASRFPGCLGRKHPFEGATKPPRFRSIAPPCVGACVIQGLLSAAHGSRTVLFRLLRQRRLRCRTISPRLSR